MPGRAQSPAAHSPSPSSPAARSSSLPPSPRPSPARRLLRLRGPSRPVPTSASASPLSFRPSPSTAPARRSRLPLLVSRQSKSAARSFSPSRRCPQRPLWSSAPMVYRQPQHPPQPPSRTSPLSRPPRRSSPTSPDPRPQATRSSSRLPASN
ncbi:hypothetical protein B0T11DRAFT_275898 [Plectosphaerella cucumerina]|uniref:Uncharacterized protein n=1 Tax=Plectosphaerella cucumerina TaxID=40658 RepID=A0A8K0TJV4_9PEZI|nr:hypothetical protein B0T11DRAFT_275898 [Plectosphaerella cucumerina]